MSQPSERRRSPMPGYIRLAVNINTESAAALKEITQRRTASYTETLRRAVSLLKLIEDETQKGHNVQVNEGKRVRNIVLSP
ncbi:CopG family transcriptional regulator [Parafrankia sp. EAN1pec]|uniref:CopG family transcriptional regulator n=1 Tax=Parafrankia sp. (strain EAN1pec) TaxID=298653 RepID=UPI00321B4D9D